MDKQDNPYMNFVEMIIKQVSRKIPIFYMIGTVINNMPLLIQLGEIQLERDDLKINEGYLLQNAVGSLDYNEYSFKIGEKLAILVSQDQQEFVLIAKVR